MRMRIRRERIVGSKEERKISEQEKDSEEEGK